MVEFLKFLVLSIGSALVVTLILAAVAKPLSAFVRSLIYSSPEHRAANLRD
jgi:hypothetical protein